MTQTKVWDGSQWLALPPGPVGPKGAKGDTGDTGGSLAMRWDETVGRRLFVQKDAGEQMVYGDTGERNVKSLLLNGIVSESVGEAVRLRRVGNIVTIYLGIIVPGGASSPTEVMQLPLGFRPATNVSMYMPPGYSGSAQVVIGGAYSMNIYGTFTVGSYHRYLWSWSTNDAWPTVLPGLAIGVIPSGA